MRARLLAVLACELTWHPDHARRIATANEAVTVARSPGDPTTLLFAILRPGGALMVPETSEQRVQLFREAADLATRINDPIAHADAILMLAPTLLEPASGGLSSTRNSTPRQKSPRRSGSPSCGGSPAPSEDVWPSPTATSNKASRTPSRRCRSPATADYPTRKRRTTSNSSSSAGIRVVSPRSWTTCAASGRSCRAQPPGRSCPWQKPSAVTGKPPARMLEAAAQAGFNSFYGAPWLGGMCLWADVAAELDDPRSGAIALRTTGSLEGPLRHRRTRSHSRRQPLPRTARSAAGQSSGRRPPLRGLDAHPPDRAVTVRHRRNRIPLGPTSSRPRPR